MNMEKTTSINFPGEAKHSNVRVFKNCCTLVGFVAVCYFVAGAIAALVVPLYDKWKLGHKYTQEDVDKAVKEVDDYIAKKAYKRNIDMGVLEKAIQEKLNECDNVVTLDEMEDWDKSDADDDDKPMQDRIVIVDTD